MLVGNSSLTEMCQLSEYLRKMFYSFSNTGSLEEKIWVLPIAVEPMTFLSLVTTTELQDTNWS